MGFVSVAGSLTQWSFHFWKDHFAPVTGNKIIHMQETIQPRAYCSTKSMTGSQWKFGEQSDDLVSR